MQELFKLAIGGIIMAVVFLVLIMFVPTIMSSVETAQPDLAADSDWNSSFNTDLPDVADTYSSLSSILVAVVIIIIVGIAIFALLRMGNTVGV